MPVPPTTSSPAALPYGASSWLIRPGSSSTFLPTVLLTLLLIGCGGGGSDTDQVPSTDGDQQSGDQSQDQGQGGLGQDQNPDSGIIGEVGDPTEPSELVPDALDSADQIGLTIDAESRCAIVGETFDLQVALQPNTDDQAGNEPGEFEDISAYVTLTQGLGRSLELISRGDGAIQLRHRQQDIVSLTADVGNGSVTAYLAGFDTTTPERVVLQKPVPGGCLYALRTPGYCATGIARSGQFSIGIADQAITAQGCDLENPAAHPVVVLDTAVE